jgi:hypothetical protein
MRSLQGKKEHKSGEHVNTSIRPLCICDPVWRSDRFLAFLEIRLRGWVQNSGELF